MWVATFVKLHPIDKPTRLRFFEGNSYPGIDGDRDSRLSVNDRMLSEENALARRARKDHGEAWW